MATNDSVINIGANADSFNRVLADIRKDYEVSMKALEGDTSDAAESARKSLQKAFDKSVQDSFKDRWRTNSKEIKQDAEEIGEEISGWFKVTAISTGFLAIKGGFQSIMGLAQGFGAILDRGAELERIGIALKQSFGDTFDPARADAFVNNLRSISNLDAGAINQEMARFGASDYSQSESEALMRLALDVAAGTGKGLEDVSKTIREIGHGDLSPIKDLIGYQLEATGDLAADSEAGLQALRDRFDGLAQATASSNVTLSGLLDWARDEFAQGIFSELKDDLQSWKQDLSQYLSSDQFRNDISMLVSATGLIAKGLVGAARGVGAVGEAVVGGVLGSANYTALKVYNTQRDISDMIAAMSITQIDDGINKSSSAMRAEERRLQREADEQRKREAEAKAELEREKERNLRREEMYQQEVERERDRREREAERYADQLERERERALKLAVQQPINLNVFGNSTSRLSYARGF